MPAPASPPAPSTAAPPAASKVPSLSAAQIDREIFTFARGGVQPVNGNGRPVAVQRDIGSVPEVFSVFASVPTSSDADVTTLSDFGRLFKPDLKPVSYFLKVFTEGNGHLHLQRTVSLGDYYVFETLRTISIHRDENLPFAVSTVFQTADGSDDRWVIFSGRGTSRFTLKETLFRSPIVEDIDGDGYLDIIYRERGMEEGTGYETFLTWYKWNGIGYREYRSTNIVRNLREFLGEASDLLESRNFSAFLTMALPRESLASLRREGNDDSGIFFRLFRTAPSSFESPNPPLSDIASLSKVIFPNVLESPFALNSSSGYRFPLTVRLVSSDDVSHFYTATIVMNRNPFVSPQFSFSVFPTPHAGGTSGGSTR